MLDSQALRIAIEHHQAGRHAEAEAAYRACLARDPGHAMAWNNFAVLALGAREWEAALDRASRAIALQPGNVNYHCTRAFALNGLGRAEEVVGLCLEWLRTHRDCAPAWFALGEAQVQLGRDDEAVASYRTALELKPDYGAAANNLGNVLSNLNDFDGAIAAFRAALQLMPASAEVHNNLGAALREAGRHDEAITSLRRALELNPHLSKAHSGLILAMLYTAGTTAAALAEEGARWWRRHGAPLWRADRPFPQDRDPDRPLRVGYVSADFREHPVGRHLAPLLREHDRQHFAITVYSGVRGPDGETARLRASEVTWREVRHASDEALAAQIEADAIDLLVDLSLHSADDRLTVFARQPAPVQISFAGYPGETGLESIAWHLTDRVLEPERAGALYLPDSFWCIDPPADSPVVNPLPALSGEPFVFGCLHKFAKVNAPTLDLWGEILRALPAARLVMLCPLGEARERVTAALSARGVAPERIELVAFLPRPDYLALHGRIDAILDTFPYNGHMTAIDALWMGVPLVSLVGELPVSRGGASILHQVGLGDLVARTPEEYVRIAIALAQDLPRLAALRAALRERVKASPLMDGARFSHGVEAAYRTAWRRWCAG
jgi:predicted O-linked N-acetylglucosamine transferase (SPINDLY family)